MESEGPPDPGPLLEILVRDYLAQSLLPPDRFKVTRGAPITSFQQYEHLARLASLTSEYPLLRTEIGQDYLVAPDVTVGIQTSHSPIPWLHAAVSCKWTIRSDRVQNIRHEGIILTRHRRGRQPHVATVTAEPLPSRLAAIARGTGEVDGVYHLCLSELRSAVEGHVSQAAILDELIDQERLFDMPTLVRTISET